MVSGRLLLMVVVLVGLYLVPPVLDVFCGSCWLAALLMRHSSLYFVYVLGVSVVVGGSAQLVSGYMARSGSAQGDDESPK